VRVCVRAQFYVCLYVCTYKYGR